MSIWMYKCTSSNDTVGSKNAITVTSKLILAIWFHRRTEVITECIGLTNKIFFSFMWNDNGSLQSIDELQSMQQVTHAQE